MSPAPGTAVPIVLYHSVSTVATEPYAPWTVTPRRLAEHLDGLAAAGYTPVPLGVLVDAIRGADELPIQPIVVTFDDGLQDFAEGALPLLRDRQIPATLFVTTAFVGRTSEWLQPLGEGRRSMLSWDGVADVASEGIHIGSHGHTHRPLDELAPGVAAEELRCSRELLEQHVRRPVTALAYPHGYHTAALAAAAREVGYTSACAVRNALSSTGDDVMALARMTVPGNMSTAALLRALAPDRSRVAPYPEQLRTKVWRHVRRARRRTRDVLRR